MTLPTRCLRVFTAVILFIPSFVQQAQAAESISVMTFNIRYASAFGVNSWPKRRAEVVQIIREQKPDLFGTQEGLHHQLLFMDKELPKYGWIGLGREARGIHGRFLPAGTVQADGAKTFLAFGYARKGRLGQLGQLSKAHGHVGSFS